jgi:5-methyltetrahydrofolate--homocysteine methyltransferase
MIETILDVREAACALVALRDLAPVVCSFSLAEEAPGVFKTLRGTTVREAIGMAVEEGAVVVGANCTLDPDGMTRLAPGVLEAAGDTPVILRPNAGQPHELEAGLDYPVHDGAFATFTTACRALGVRFIGGCCGTTPETIRAMRRAVAAGA